MWKNVSVFGLIGLAGFSTLAAAQTADDYKVTTLPGLSDAELSSISQYAGHIEVSPETNGNLFFWMVEQAHKTQAEKLIIWLNGGPGCSSMDGLFLENGPYRVNPDLSLNISAGGWQDHATIVFLDQPVGTGFSFVDSMGYLRNMTQIAEEFTTFLDKFFDIFPNFKDQDMYLAGESFAGTYIPYFAARMLKLNQDGERNYNLQGIAIGNGWISPKHQYDAYYDFAVLKDLLSAEYKEYAFDELDRCHRALARSERIHISECEQILDIIIDASVHEEDGVKYCINQYDIRMKNEKMPSCGMDWPRELADVTNYLRSPELIAAVHAEKQELGWVECSRGVSTQMRDDASEPSYRLLPDILQEIPVLLFSGDQDLICNVLGTEYLLGNMTWNGAKGYSSSKTLDWFIDEKKVGTYTEARNLTFVVVENGSHMLPYDRPLETLDMINRFMGVGNNQVNGKTSRVGPVSKAEKPEEKPVETGGDESKPPVIENEEEEEKEEQKKKQQQQQQQQQQDEEEEETPEEPDLSSEDKWAQYYSWGTSALIVVILFAGLVGYCWYRSGQAKEGYSQPGARRASGSGNGLLGWLFNRGGRSKRAKLRLDDQDDTNELDELVVETPTLFAAEDYSDEDRDNQNNSKTQNIKKSPTRFAIADEGDEDDDDDSEGFADWEAEDPVTTKPPTHSKKDKEH